MEYETLVVDVQDTIAVVTINRPQVLNALNGATMRELDAAIEALMADDRVGAIVLTGAGERAFVAGADIREFNNLRSARAAAEYARSGQAVLSRMESGPKPVIAAINGFALGGGCELAMACDIRLAADTAQLGQPEINLGILPGYGGTQRLARLVGPGTAKLLCLGGDPIPAEEALRIGLVDRVVPAAELRDQAEGLAHKLASKAPVARALIKQAINVGLGGSLEEGLAYEAAQFGLAFDTQDRVEGVTAFLEKRTAQWSGT
jgi:enoyl-CoA hydratase